jgi:hypothetical protein
LRVRWTCWARRAQEEVVDIDRAALEPKDTVEQGSEGDAAGLRLEARLEQGVVQRLVVERFGHDRRVGLLGCLRSGGERRELRRGHVRGVLGETLVDRAQPVDGRGASQLGDWAGGPKDAAPPAQP